MNSTNFFAAGILRRLLFAGIPICCIWLAVACVV